MVLTVRKPSTARYRQTHARLSHNSWLVCTPHEYFIILDISSSKIDFNKSPEEFPIPYFLARKNFGHQIVIQRGNERTERGGLQAGIRHVPMSPSSAKWEIHASTFLKQINDFFTWPFMI